MGWNPKRCIPGATITLFACRVLDELRWFGTTGVTHVARVSFPVISASQSAVKRPPLSVTCSLICIVSITFTHPLCLSLPCFSLKCFRLYLSMCLSPSLSFLLPSPSQTVDWYGDTRLHVFLALPQMGPWQHVRDQNVLYLSCQAVPRDQNGSRPLLGGGEKPSLFQSRFLIVSFGMAKWLLLLKVQMDGL